MGRFARFARSPKRLVLAGLCLLVAAGLLHSVFAPISAAQMGPRSLKLSTADVDATADYLLSFNLSTAGTLGSVQVQFCSNDPFPGTACATPGGFDASSAVLADQTGPGGFSIDPTSTSNNIVLTRAAASAPVGTVTFHFTGVKNPSSTGSYYVRLQTFANTDASGTASNDGGIAFAIVNGLTITALVPPFLTFCTGVTIPGFNCANANGDFIDFGELSSNHASSGSSQMLVATNALDGYNISVDGTTLTSGVNAIDALATNDVSRPGTPQFGFNLRANTTPAGGGNPAGPGTGVPRPAYNQINSYRFVPGETLVSNSAPDNVRVYTASYITNVPKTQPAGVYVSTLTYICLADF